MNLQETYIDLINKLIEKLEVKEFEVDYWRTMWAMQCGATSYWAHVSYASDIEREQLSKNYKLQHHMDTIEQMKAPHEQALKDENTTDAAHTYNERKLNQIERMHL